MPEVPANRIFVNLTNFNFNKEDKKRQTSPEIKVKDEMIALILPPKSVKNKYLEQNTAKYVFKWMNGDIHIPEYGL